MNTDEVLGCKFYFSKDDIIKDYYMTNRHFWRCLKDPKLSSKNFFKIERHKIPHPPIFVKKTRGRPRKVIQ